jgi:tetratricopeptide (TPR) repeat protein
MLQEKLYKYIQNPESALENYELGLEYDRLGQLASAVSFYIRTAEKAQDSELIYSSLILAASCFERQQRRKYTVEGLLQHAVSIFPTRPEAHFHLCKLYEQTKKWRELILHATMGLSSQAIDKNDVLQYPGKASLLFYRALGNYQIGLFEKAKTGFLELAYLEQDVGIIYKTLSRNNLINLGYPDTLVYTKNLMHRYKFPFKGLDTIEFNYSKHFQDMFILSILDGKQNGYYVEFGAGDPYETNNTALLETKFGWKGISYDSNPNRCYEFAAKRSNSIFCKNVLTIDIEKEFDEVCAPEFIDYLQIDIDEGSLELLTKIPFDNHTFGIIQFEHDKYRLDPAIKEKATEFLRSKGYILLVNNVAFNEKDCYEDWWVHPSLYRKDMEALNDVNFVIQYFLST